MSKGNNWIALDKNLQQEFKKIRRKFSMIEAMFSYSLDQDRGNKGSIAGYAMLWGWSRNKVRRFKKGIKSVKGHLKDTRRTVDRHPIHFIDTALMTKKDRRGTEEGQKTDTTNKTKPKTNKEIYTDNFNSFWEKYPKKSGKVTAFKAYKNIKKPTPTLKMILKAIIQQKKTEQWSDIKYIPLPATWLNQRRWEDEIETDKANDLDIARSKKEEQKQINFLKARKGLNAKLKTIV